MMIEKMVANPAVGYILTRYITYGIQLINSILIAVYLGPVYLGIWGFIMLITQYLNQINFGIGHAVQTITAVNKHNENYISGIAGNGVVLLSILSILLCTVFFLNFYFEWGFGEKYNFGTYSGFILFIAIISHYNSLLSNILRIYGRIAEMAVSQSILPLATLATLFFFKQEVLLTALVWVYTLTTLASFVIFMLRMPIKIKINFNKKLTQTIQRKGWHLFIYNSSFYLILISTRSFVSYFFDIKEFGLFTFAFSLASVLVLLFDSFSFLVWPKLLNRLAKLNNIDSAILLNKVRKLYLTCTHGMLHLGILLFPFFIMIFPAYKDTYTSFCLIALTIVLFTNSFGYQGLIIARGKERAIGNLSFLILILNVVLCYVLIRWFMVNFEYVILATLFSYLIYTVFLNILGRQIFELKRLDATFLNDVFPIKLLLPFSSSLLCVFLDLEVYYFFIPLCLFVFLNFTNLKEISNTTKKLMANPRFFEI